MPPSLYLFSYPMNLPLRLPAALARRRCLALAFALFAFLSLRAADGGAVSGTVNNSATKNNLAGARIEIPALAVSVLSDSSGRYVLNNLPAGSHELVASYIGLDTMRVTVNITAGQMALAQMPAAGVGASPIASRA